MTSADLVQLCIGAGASTAAVLPIGAVDDHAAALYNRWIADGKNAAMGYLSNYTDIRRNPELLLPGARTMVCCAFAYDAKGWPRSSLFADYARGDDYHDVLRCALRTMADILETRAPGSQTRICVDTAPILERYWALRSGLGFQGLNCHVIVPSVGSKVFLAEVLWTEPVDYNESESAPASQGRTPTLAPGCGACRRCVEACPTHALDGKGGMDARRCLSYLTIENRGELPADLSLNGRIYGCDICQDVCPHNAIRPRRALEAFAPRKEILALDADAIAAMTHADFNAIFRRSAIKRVKYDGLMRNISRRNSGGAHDGKN